MHAGLLFISLRLGADIRMTSHNDQMVVIDSVCLKCLYEPRHMRKPVCRVFDQV